jgi:hypothetical protein
VTVLSDGAEIMKRPPTALPTAHIIDWFHIAMKIQPLQQNANHIVRWRDAGNSEMAQVDANVRSLKWRLWHGQTDRALDQLETMTMTMNFARLRERGNLSATRLLHVAHPLLTYVRLNKSAIINYGARYRSGRRNKPIDRGSRGCSSRQRRCSRRRNNPVNLTVPFRSETATFQETPNQVDERRRARRREGAKPTPSGAAAFLHSFRRRKKPS